MTYEQWTSELNRLLALNNVGLTTADLHTVEFNLEAMHANGDRPRKALAKIIDKFNEIFLRNATEYHLHPGNN